VALDAALQSCPPVARSVLVDKRSWVTRMMARYLTTSTVPDTSLPANSDDQARLGLANTQQAGIGKHRNVLLLAAHQHATPSPVHALPSPPPLPQATRRHDYTTSEHRNFSGALMRLWQRRQGSIAAPTARSST
jgi:hypothetical protein